MNQNDTKGGFQDAEHVGRRVAPKLKFFRFFKALGTKLADRWQRSNFGIFFKKWNNNEKNEANLFLEMKRWKKWIKDFIIPPPRRPVAPQRLASWTQFDFNFSPFSRKLASYYRAEPFCFDWFFWRMGRSAADWSIRRIDKQLSKVGTLRRTAH